MPKERWPHARSPNEFLERYLSRLRADSGSTVTQLIAEFEERKSFEYQCFSMYGRTTEDRAQYETHDRRLDSAIDTLRDAGRRGIVQDLTKGAVVAIADCSPHETGFIVPPRYWPFLDLNFDSASAKSATITFRNIRFILFSDLSEDQRDTVNANICWAAAKLKETEEKRTAGGRMTSAEVDDPLHASLQTTTASALLEPDEWQKGVTLNRTAELLGPDAWAVSKTYIPLVVLGDPKSESRHFRALEALETLRKVLYSRLIESVLELRVLHPPGEPGAKWTSVSRDVLEAIKLETIDFEMSTIEIRNGQPVEVRVFQSRSEAIGTEVAEASITPSAHEPSPKIPIYTRVSDAWMALPDEVRNRTSQRGGKKAVAQLIHQRMPDVPFASLERELRRLFSNEQLTKTGEEPGK